MSIFNKYVSTTEYKDCKKVVDGVELYSTFIKFISGDDICSGEKILWRVKLADTEIGHHLYVVSYNNVAARDDQPALPDKYQSYQKDDIVRGFPEVYVSLGETESNYLYEMLSKRVKVWIDPDNLGYTLMTSIREYVRSAEVDNENRSRNHSDEEAG